MSAAAKRSFSLPTEQSDYIDKLVASGTYATSSEVIRAGLRALQERDEAVERWLREEVVPTALAMEANPERGIPDEQVFAKLRRRPEERLKRDDRVALYPRELSDDDLKALEKSEPPDVPDDF